MTVEFSNRVAVVTGAGGGLGRSHALLLAARGARVVVNDTGPSRRPGPPEGHAADDVVAEIVAAGGRAVAHRASIADPEGAQSLVDLALSAFGRIDVLVNNAGVLRDRTFAKLELADWELVRRVHLDGSAFCTHAAWPHMRAAGYGRIVFTTSSAGLHGSFGQSNYAAAKMGLVGLMNVLRLEGAKHGILVNTVAPLAATAMTEGVLPASAMPHFAPEHASAAVALLCSEAFQRSGVILSAGAGHFAVVEVASTAGVQFDPAAPPDPERLLAEWERIADRSALRRFAEAGAETAAILEAIRARE